MCVCVCVCVCVSLWILGTIRTFFILLQVSLQFGLDHTGMSQGLINEKYFIWLFLRKIAFFVKMCCIRDTMLRMQHSDVAYATLCCICDTMLRRRHPYVAYATTCCICDINVTNTHKHVHANTCKRQKMV